MSIVSPSELQFSSSSPRRSVEWVDVLVGGAAVTLRVYPPRGLDYSEAPQERAGSPSFSAGFFSCPDSSACE